MKIEKNYNLLSVLSTISAFVCGLCLFLIMMVQKNTWLGIFLILVSNMCGIVVSILFHSLLEELNESENELEKLTGLKTRILEGGDDNVLPSDNEKNS